MTTKKELEKMNERIRLILTGVRNLLHQNNVNGVNDYLVNKIDREL